MPGATSMNDDDGDDTLPLPYPSLSLTLAQLRPCHRTREFLVRLLAAERAVQLDRLRRLVSRLSRHARSLSLSDWEKCEYPLLEGPFMQSSADSSRFAFGR